MAWADLEPILHREGIARDAPHLLHRLYAVTEAADAAARRRALTAAADAVGADGLAARLLRLLGGEDDPDHRRLALELAARVPEPALADWLRPLLRDRRIPAGVRLAAAAALVRKAPRSAAGRVLRDFAAGYGRARFVNRRSILRKRFTGRRRLFERYATRLAARLPVACPRCRARLPRAALGRHLWDRHRLLFDGRHVRSPARLIDHWVAGPQGSVAAAHRQLLRRGGRDDDSLAALRGDAARRRAGLCPHCYTAVPLDAAAVASLDDFTPLTLSHGRLSGHGFVLELTRHRSGSWLRIETPGGILFDGSEPGLRTAKPRQARLAAVPLIVLAVLLAALLPSHWALLGTTCALLAALGLAVLLRSGEPDDRPDRVIDHAWRLLVPRLLAVGSDAAGAEFLAALAVSSVGRGDARIRERPLKRVIQQVREASRTGPVRPVHVIALKRLQIADAAAVDGDAVLAVADAVRPCLASAWSPATADLLLTDDLFAGWTRGERARLRVLLTARAFADGLGVWDLHALGRAVPGLGRVLNVEDTDGLARLRLLWDLRPTRPWQQCGPAATVFELANYPMLGGQHLETAPDLLLFQPLPAGGEPVHLLACGRGLIVGEALLYEWPARIDARPLPTSKGGGYELRFGPHSVQVRGNADELVRRLAMWGRYFFEEFLPWIGNALTRPGDGSPDRLAPLTVTCPECGTAFLARRGELGRPL